MPSRFKEETTKSLGWGFLFRQQAEARSGQEPCAHRTDTGSILHPGSSFSGPRRHRLIRYRYFLVKPLRLVVAARVHHFCAWRTVYYLTRQEFDEKRNDDTRR